MRVWRPHIGIGLIVVLIVIAAAPTLVYPLGRDQGEFATIGRGILNGRIPYVDLWNPKPPAVFYVYAAAIALAGDGSTIGLRALDLALMPLVMIGLYVISLRLFGQSVGRRIGWIAAALFGLFYFTETFWTLTQNDGLALVPMTGALYSTIEAARSRSGKRGARIHAAIAGLLAGVTFWFKYPFVLFIAALPIIYLLLRRWTAERVDRAAAASFIGGLALTGGGIAGVLIAQGAWADLIESARVTAGYAALGLEGGAVFDWLGTALGFRWSHWGLLFVLAGVGLIASIIPVARPLADDLRTRRQASAIHVIWALAGAAILLVQAKGYDYHWLPLLPPLCLIAAAGLERIAGWIGTALRPMLVTGAVIALIAGTALSVWPPVLTGTIRFVAGEFDAAESLRVAAYLRERTTPGDSLFIWGFRPEIYYLADLNPATRYIFQFPLVGSWYPAAWRQQAVEVLWAALPPYVLVVQGDFLPWVTGRDADSAMLLQEYEELNDWLIYNYEREAQIGTFQVWRRKPAP
ncbi:MAG: glycosyltransferase family 39 protein [Candidatus Flexifilum sp.]